MGNGLLTNLIVIFVGIIVLFFVGIIAYSKAYRVKNRVIEILEKYNTVNINDTVYSQSIRSEIENSLSGMGYRLANGNKKCDIRDVSGTDYDVCIYYYTVSSDKNQGFYYDVVTYVHFEFPVIGDLLSIPVRGQTKILGKSYNYE